MDRFILNWKGNKYQETKKYLKTFIENNNFDYVAEPFGGIFGFSRYYYLLKSNTKTKFLINDIDVNLINFYISLQKDFNKTLDNLEEQFLKITKDFKEDIELTHFLRDNKNNKDYYLITKAADSVSGCFSITKFKTKLKNFRVKENEYKDMFKRCEFYNSPADEFIKTVKNKNDDILFYFDPPYFNSNNTDYDNSFRDKNKYYDGTSIYINILEIMETTNLKCLFVLNKIDVINYIFKKFIYLEYEGQYQNISKKPKHHIVYKNF